jgi:hypothetical protein
MWFSLTFRDRSREPDLAIRSRRIGTLCEKSAPRKVTKSHIIIINREQDLDDCKGQKF